MTSREQFHWGTFIKTRAWDKPTRLISLFIFLGWSLLGFSSSHTAALAKTCLVSSLPTRLWAPSTAFGHTRAGFPKDRERSAATGLASGRLVSWPVRVYEPGPRPSLERPHQQRSNVYQHSQCNNDTVKHVSIMQVGQGGRVFQVRMAVELMVIV